MQECSKKKKRRKRRRRRIRRRRSKRRQSVTLKLFVYLCKSLFLPRVNCSVDALHCSGLSSATQRQPINMIRDTDSAIP